MAYVGTPRYLGSDQATLASIIYGEAGNQGLVGMQAVGAVITNRANGVAGFTGYGQGNIMDVALYPRQFQGQNANYNQTAWDVAGNVLNGTNPDPTGGATYYANPATSTPGNWGSRLNSSNSLQIGSHYFTDNQNGTPFQPSVTGAPPTLATGPGDAAPGDGFAPITGSPGFARVVPDVTDGSAGGPGFSQAGGDGTAGITDGSAGGPGFQQAGMPSPTGPSSSPTSQGPTSSPGGQQSQGQGAPINLGLQAPTTQAIGGWVNQAITATGQGLQATLKAAENSIATFFGGVANWFIRGFLIILGAILIILAISAMTGQSVMKVA